MTDLLSPHPLLDIIPALANKPAAKRARERDDARLAADQREQYGKAFGCKMRQGNQLGHSVWLLIAEAWR